MDPDKPLFFLHIPKTAGTTLRTIIERSVPHAAFFQIGKEAEAELYDPKQREAFWHKVAGYRILSGHVRMYFLGQARNNFHFLTMLRHPVERVLSLHGFYRGIKDTPANEADAAKLQMAHRLDPARFAETDHPLLRGEVSNGMCRVLVEAPHRRIDSMDAVEIFEQARANLQTMTFGLSEAMEQSMALFSHTLPVYPSGSIPRINVTSERQTASTLAIADYERILRVNLADLLLYEWAVREFNRRLEAIHQEQIVSHHRRHPMPDFRADDEQPGRWIWRVDDSLCGDNWHEVERLANGTPYRFTGPTNRSVLWFSLPSAGGALKVSLLIVISVDDPVLEYARIELNGHPVPHVHRWVPDRGVFLTASLPAAYVDARGLLSVTILTPFTVVPAREKTGSLDRRSLGLGLSSVSIESA